MRLVHFSFGLNNDLFSYCTAMGIKMNLIGMYGLVHLER